MRALIDGDILRYRIGFAAQNNIYHVLDGEEYLYTLDNYQDTKEVDEEFVIEKEIIPEPVENAIHSLKMQIDFILKQTKASSYIIFLTEGKNYRDDIAVSYPYKGNRKDFVKPIHFDRIGDYIKDNYTTFVVDGQEADDAMGIEQMKHLYDAGYPSTTICTIDKDLNMIPGWHYNFVKDHKYWVSEWEAITWFYTQLLTGDTVDNIKGIKGIGPYKAKKLLSNCEDELSMYSVVKESYEKEFKEDADARLLENGRLLWIRRTEGELWESPK